MNRDNLFVFTSSILLIIAILTWQELFVFAKTTANYPLWAKKLPYPMMGAHLLALVAFAPVVLLSRTGISVIKNTVITLFLSIPAAIIFLIFSNDASLTINRFTNGFVWVALVNCFPPAITLMLVRVVINIVIGKKVEKEFDEDIGSSRSA